MRMGAQAFNYTINEETGQLQNVNGQPLDSTAAEAVRKHTANLVLEFEKAGGGSAGLRAASQLASPSLAVDTTDPDVDFRTNSPLREILDTAEEATKLGDAIKTVQ